MRHFFWTWIGLGLFLVLFCMSNYLDFHLFEWFISWLDTAEVQTQYELVIPSFVLIFFVILDEIRRKKKRQIASVKQEIYRSMLQASDHVVKNFLNQMQLFRLTAEETPDFNPQVIAQFDEIIKNATDQMHALREVEKVDEEAIQHAVGLK